MTKDLLIGAFCIALAIMLIAKGWQHRSLTNALGPAIAGAIFVPGYILFRFSFDGFALLGALASVPFIFVYALALFGLGRAMRWITGYVFR